jgi:hypothetical protein
MSKEKPTVRHIPLGTISNALNEGMGDQYGLICGCCKAAYINDLGRLTKTVWCPCCFNALTSVSLEEYDRLIGKIDDQKA